MAESGWASSEEQAWIRFIMAIDGRVKSLHRLVPSRLRTQNARACLSPIPLQATPAEATWSGTARVAFRENAHTNRPATQTDDGPMLLLGY